MKLFLPLMIIVITITALTGCSDPGYLCPVDGMIGACASEMQAYRTSLHANAEGESIFESNNPHDSNDEKNTKNEECLSC